jgi:uncharacterized membrane protein
MAEEKTISQRKFGTRLIFQFARDQMPYTIRDYSGERQFSVPYESINVLTPASLVINKVQFYRTLLIVPLIVIGISIGIQSSDRAASQYLILLGVALFVVLLIGRQLKLFAVKFTTLQMTPVPPGAGTTSLMIIKDKTHSAILEEIKTRWRVRLKQLHGAINFSNDASKEIAKFTWLKDRAVITDEEYREAVEKLRAYAMQTARQSPERTLN